MENMEFLKAMLAEMNARMYTTQEKIDANTKGMQERMNKMKEKIKEDMNANRKANREGLKEMMEEMMNANQAKMNTYLKEMREEIKSGQAEMRSIVNAWMANMRDDGRETVSCQVTMAVCLDSKEPKPEIWNPKQNIRRSLRKMP
jgi:DNA anti-recombination protein RmuC